MLIDLRPLTVADAEAHRAGEDDETVRWLSGGRAPLERTRAWIREMEHEVTRPGGRRGYGIWLDGRLAGYVEANPAETDGLDPGDVNVSYCVHPWARGRGVAGKAIDLLCARLADDPAATAAAVRIDVANHASIRVAEKLPGFSFVREFTSTSELDVDGRPAVLRLYRRPLPTALSVPGRSVES